MFIVHTDSMPLFSESPKSEFEFEVTRYGFNDYARIRLDNDRLEVEQKGIPFLSSKLMICMPFTGNSKWFSIYDDNIPFSTLYNDKAPNYSIIESDRNQRSIKITMNMSFNEDETIVRRRANEPIKALNEYINILCPQGPTLKELAERMKFER